MSASTSSVPNLAEEIYADLLARILSGALASGERLPGERELSERYSTNRNTLREAFRKLEQEKLIFVRHGQGVTVADFRKTGQVSLLGAFFEHGRDPREKARALLDLLPARARVIEFALSLAAERADASDLKRLAEGAAWTIAAHESGDDAAVALGFQRWLDALVDAAHSLPLRWTANPMFQTERDIHARFPAFYMREPTLPSYLRETMAALEKDDTATAISATRAYFGAVDAKVVAMLQHGFGEVNERKRSRRHDT